MSKENSIVNAAEIERPEEAHSNNHFGMVLFLISEAFLFGSLFWTYYYLRATTAVWPPAGVNPDLGLASVNTFLLLSSSAVMWWGGRAIRHGNQKALAAGLAVSMALGLIFLGITIFEWTHESFRPWTHAYGSIFYTLTGFHALHVFAGIVLLLALLTRSLKGRFSATNFKAVEIGSLYWHYVDFIWILVFTSLFIVK
jgi:heme/copper-type cytochrome/quinol oxidase subunit 3